MAGPCQVAGLGLRIDRHMNRRGPVRSRDTGRNVFPRIDRDGEGRAEGGGILHRLLREMEFFNSLRRQGETDQPAGMPGHEVDSRRRDMLSSHDEIAFVLTIFVIDKDDELSALDIPNGVFDAVKRSSHDFNTNGEWSMVNVRRKINLSFTIDHITLFFWARLFQEYRSVGGVCH